MDKFPICWKGASVGELTVEKELLHTCFSAKVSLPKNDGLWCVWLVGNRGEVRLGIPEPTGETATICRRFSDRMAAPLGNLLRGELRPVAKKHSAWEPVLSPENLFRSQWLHQRIKGYHGILSKQSGNCKFLAVPYDKGNAFPFVDLFCFSSCLKIEGRSYLVFAFDEKERVTFCERGVNSIGSGLEKN